VISKTVTFEGYDGKKYTEEYFFHMTKADLIEMKLYLEETGLDDYFRKISASDKASVVLPHFKDIVSKCIGVMSEDGRRHDKRNGDVWLEFIQTPAYSEFFTWLLENPTDAAKFFTGILPKELQDEAVEAQKAAQNQMALPLPGEESQDNRPKRFQDYTRQELLDMSQEQYDALVGTDLAEMSKAQLQITTHRLALQKQTESRNKAS
jgi:hypothetical protein